MAKESEESKIQSGLDGNFDNMTLIQRIRAIDKAVDESIRAFLVQDGGDMEVIDIKDDGEFIDVYIRYLGACNGCASSTTGTLFAIEEILQEKLSAKIRVLPI